MQPRDDVAANDRALLSRIAAGDRTAFEAFFRAYERRVFRYVRRLLNDDALANEVASDVMVEVWRGATRFAGRSKPSTWVLGIAHNKAIDALRRERRELALLRVAETPADMTDEPERLAIESSTREELELALDTLSPEHRAVLHLTYVLDCSQNEIAAIVGCPLGTVKTRVYHGKRALRAALTSAGNAREAS
jgi:RNA polymerase sigma-70 factor (ECF subfamily)